MKLCQGYMIEKILDNKRFETLFAVREDTGEILVASDVPSSSCFDMPGRVWVPCGTPLAWIIETAEFIGNYPIVRATPGAVLVATPKTVRIFKVEDEAPLCGGDNFALIDMKSAASRLPSLDAVKLELDRTLPADYKVGRGGSHVWVSRLVAGEWHRVGIVAEREAPVPTAAEIRIEIEELEERIEDMKADDPDLVFYANKIGELKAKLQGAK